MVLSDSTLQFLLHGRSYGVCKTFLVLCSAALVLR